MMADWARLILAVLALVTGAYSMVLEIRTCRDTGGVLVESRCVRTP
jgi:hypothetical protein